MEIISRGSAQDDDGTARNRPEDVEGDGPVTVQDRTEPGGQGSPGSNQGKTEPMPPSGSHSQPLAAPELGDMSVGSADPQAPRHPDALRSELSGTGGYAHEPAGAPAPEQPERQTAGTAHRTPGMLGTTPDGESVTTDTTAGAARMGPQALDSTPDLDGQPQGDDQSGSLPGEEPAAGTSEEHHAVAGVKLPQEDH